MRFASHLYKFHASFTSNTIVWLIFCLDRLNPCASYNTLITKSINNERALSIIWVLYQDLKFILFTIYLESIA
jgi:hypothetical protein